MMTRQNAYGKVRVQITDAPRHIVMFDNGKRTRLFPVVVGQASRRAAALEVFARIAASNPEIRPF